jgi:serine/threonine-protein kinase
MEPAGTAREARRFGKYTLVAKLAAGGMAEIFLARLHGDGGFEKLVCIKRILPHLAKDPQFVAMFLDEARVAARISHPNVCQVFELGEYAGQYYIAMEYLEGVPLSVFRRKDFYAALPDPRLVAGFGVQACEGLHHAHQLRRPDGELLGVVHRDISGQNLFATTDGVIKVLDFGIAKVQDASVRTSTGAVKGTYAYMAPEQLRNETLDRRADVWAIGAVLWETLAQRHLFKRETEFLTFEAITKLPIPSLLEARPDVPPLLADTITRALSRNPDDRFATARALGEALAQAVGPLGGAASSAMISDEVSRSFEATLAEQRMLLRIAREGGQFDLDRTSPLVAHGTSISTTPAANMQRRVEEARAEVAHFVAASEAIESLYEDEDLTSRPGRRFPTDGAFTPAPSRRLSARQEVQAADDSGIVVGHNPPQYTPQSGVYAVAPKEWREPPLPRESKVVPVVQAPPPPKPSKLPWMIATVAIAAAAATAAMLYMEQRDKPETAPNARVEPAAVPVETAPSVAVPQRIEQPIEQPVTPIETPAKTVDVPEPAETETLKRRDKPDKRKIEKVVAKPPEKSDRSDKPPDKPAASPPGMITIDSTPVYAVIYIDGKKYGETPLVNIKLAPGKHSVRAVSASGATRTMTINIESGKTAPVRRIEW